MSQTRPVVYFWAGLSVLVIDQLFKYWARYYQSQLGGSNFGITFHANPYPAFSLPLSSPWPVVLATVFFIGILAALFFLKRSSSVYGPLLLILFAAVSNLLDRARYGTVIDYLYLGPTFLNLADVTLVIGVLVSLRRTLFAKNRAK